IVNDGVTVAKEVELEDPVENIGAKLVRQAAANTNDLVGDGTTTSVVLVQRLIAKDFKARRLGREDWLQALPRALVVGFSKTNKEFQSRERKCLGVHISSKPPLCLLLSFWICSNMLSFYNFRRERVIASGGEVGRLSIVGGVESIILYPEIGPLHCWPGGLCLSRSIGDMDVGEFIVQIPYVKQMNEALRSRGLKDDTTCIVVDIIPSDNSLPPSPPPPLKETKQAKITYLQKEIS
ncbi:hypothetical protein GIB67_032289, partial [Kingdonia uniflora]